MGGNPILNFIFVGLVFALSLLLFNKTGREKLFEFSASLTGENLIERPRNNEPMEDYTQYFDSFQIPVGHRTYTYYWYEPDKPWPEGVKFPLVLILHGAPGKAYAAKFLVSEPAVSKYPAFLLVPVLAPRHLWAFPANKATLDSQYALGDMVKMIKEIASVYPVDMDRIYVIGCSDGGTGVYGAVRYFPDFFAAGVALSGAWVPGDGVNMTHMPVLAIHGKLDNVIHADQAQALTQIINSRGGDAQYVEIPDMGHQCPSPQLYTDKTWSWMFDRKLSQHAATR